MASKAIFLLLAAYAVQGSVIPNGISSSSIGGSSGSIAVDWDKEFDFAPLGLHMKIKYNDLTNIFKGGRVCVDFMVPKMLTTFTMGVSDIHMDITVKGTDLTKALFEAKVGYKMTINALIKEGTVEVVRMVESAETVTKVMINGMEIVLEDLILDTDYKNKFVMTFTMGGKVYGLRIERDSATVAVTIAGKEINVIDEIKLIINEVKLVLKDFILETDYKTKFVMALPIEGKVYGLRVERDSTKGVVLAVTIAGKEIDVINEINLVLKDFILDTDYKNKVVMTLPIGGKIYGLRIERDSTTGVVLAVTIAGKEIDVINEINIVLKDFILDTDYKNKFVMTLPIGGKIYGLRIERDSATSVVFAVTIAGKEINVIDEIKLIIDGIKLIVNEIKLVLKDLILETDYKTKFVIALPIEGKVYGLRVERDTTKGVVFAVTIAGKEIDVINVIKLVIDEIKLFLKDLILETDYKTKFVMALPIGGKVYGLRIERHATKGVICAVTIAGMEIDVINKIQLVIDEIKLVLKDFILVDTDYENKFVMTITLGGKVYGLRVERDSTEGVILAVTIAGKEINVINEIKLVLKDLTLETDYKTKFVMTFPIEGKVYGLRIERDSTKGVVFAVTIAGKEIDVIEEIKLILKDLILVDTDFKNKVVITSTIGGKVFGMRIERDSANGVVLAVTIAGKEVGVAMTVDTMAKKIHIDATVDGILMMHVLDIHYNPITTEWALYMTSNVFGTLDCEITLKKDLTSANILLNFNGITLAHVKLYGKILMGNLMPENLKYQVSYSIYQGKLAEGKLMINLDAVQAKKTLSVTLAPMDMPEVGVAMTIDTVAKKIHIDATVDGIEMMHVLDIHFNPITTEWGLYMTSNVFGALGFKTTLKKDLTAANIVVNFNGITLAQVKVYGKMEMGSLLPEVLKYEVSYSIYQSKLAEGKLLINLDAVQAKKTLSVTLAPMIMPALTFEVKGNLGADYSFDIDHKIVIGDITYYTMCHKYNVVFTAQKFVASGDDMMTLPKTSPVFLLLEGTYLGELLSNLVWNKALNIDLTVKNGLLYKMDYTNDVIVNGARHMALTVNTQTTPYVLRFHYPKGPEIMGINFGLMQLLGKDAVTCEVFYVPTKEVVIKTDIKNIMVTMTLPNMNMNPVVALEVTYTMQNEKAFECTVYKTGEVFKVNVFSTIFTPQLPILCTASTCQWSSNFQFEFDLATRISGLMPVHTFSFTVNKDFDTLIEIQHSVKTSPFFVRINCPLLLAQPLEVTAMYEAGTQMVIKANRLIPGEIKVLIVEPVHTIMYNDIKLAVLDLNLAKKTAMLTLGFQDIKLAVLDLSLAKKTAMFTVGLNDITLAVVDLSLAKKTVMLTLGFNDIKMVVLDLNLPKKSAMLNIRFNDIKLVVVDLNLTKMTALYTVGFNDIKLAVVDLNLAKKTAVFNIGLTKEPMCTITWINNSIMKNKFTVTIVLPIFGKVMDTTADWRCKDIYTCTYQAEVIGELPVLGKFHLTKSLSYLVSLIKSKVSSTVSGTSTKGLLMMATPLESTLSIEFDMPARILDGSCSASISGKSMGIVVKNNKIDQIMY